MSAGPNGNSSTEPGKATRALVYVVDDQKSVAWVVESLLTMYHYRVLVFEDPGEAAKALAKAETKPQLLITDYVMTPINGLELIEECKRVHPQLKTILYSGSVDEDFIHESKIQPDRFLKKPFQANDLVQLVETVLAS